MKKDEQTPGIEMKDFISQTLDAIIQGAVGKGLKPGNEIEFTIELTVFEKEGEKGGGFSLGVAGASIGIDGKSGSYSSVHSAGTVKFSYRFSDTVRMAVASSKPT
jgi:hypothetical protein